MTENIDYNLVEQAKKGDSTAIGKLFTHYWRAARATAYGITADYDLAEDIASEAFCAALENLHELKDSNRFGPWLHTIVVRTARHLKYSKSEKKKKDIKQVREKKIDVPQSSLEKRELSALIHEAVENLPEIIREAISLFYFEGYNIEEAACFLDIPTGTLKRRLYDGRKKLREAAGKILRGIKPMNQKRDEILKQLEDFIEQGGDNEAFHKVAQQAMRLRPLPRDLLLKVLQRHSRVGKKMATPEGKKEMESRAREIVNFLAQPSKRISDPNHIIGKVANDIRAVLPEFKEWKFDAAKSAQSLIQIYKGNFKSKIMPDGFSEGIPGAYLKITKASLFQAQDGSLRTMNELSLKRDEPPSNEEIRKCGRISDVVFLIWMEDNDIELKSVEKILKSLSEKIAPNKKYSFRYLDDPHYRSGLHMEFEDIAVPAAIGGVCIAWPGIPDGVSVATVRLFLEAWATAQSGRVVELTELAPFFKQIFKRE